MTQLDFKGIIRNISPQNNTTGNCEEIINLRLHNNSLWTIGKKQPIIEKVEFTKVYVHKYGSFENFIGVKNNKVIWFATRKENKIEYTNQEICSIYGNIEFSQLHNILLIKEDNTISKVVFEDNIYSITIIELPDIPDLGIILEKTDGIVQNDFTPLNIHTNKYEEMEAAREMIRGLINKEKSKYPEYMEGYVFLCTTYQLFDGSETKPSTPILIKVGEYVPGLIGAESEPQYDGSDSNITANIRVSDMKLQQLRVKVVNSLPEKFRDIVAQVNVYATPAYSFYDMDEIYPERVKEEAIAKDHIVVLEKKLKPENVEKLLFYRVGSVDAIEESSEMLTVKNETLTTNETMPVDASGWINTSGNMFVYNNRLHLYNIRQQLVESNMLGYLWQVRKSFDQQGERRDMTAFVYLKVNGKKLVMRYDCVCTAKNSSTIEFPQVLTFPDSRAYQIDFYDRYHNSTPVSIKLKPSATYNFAFGFPEKTEIILNVGTSQPDFPAISNRIEDSMNLIVSEDLNPYYFPPEHSYLMPGEIINLAVNTEQISSSQVGQYPLYVFTTEGIFALQIGDGKILYSNVIPISSELAVKDSNILQTKYGVIFVTEKGLKLISGQEIIDFSEPLNGEIDLEVRNTPDYVRANNNEKSYNILPYLSAVPFFDYVREAVMGYDITEDEVIISNDHYNYSYVFSLKTNTWHKITEVFSDFNRYLGLQTYEAEATPAQAEIQIKCSIAPGEKVHFVKSVTLPHLTLPLGQVTVHLEVMGGERLPFLTCKVEEGTTLLDMFLTNSRDIPENFFKIVAGENKIYSSVPLYTNLYIETPDGAELDYPFTDDVRDLMTTPIGVGETFALTLDGWEFSRITEETDTAPQLAILIANWINSFDWGLKATTDDAVVKITAQPGPAGNDIPLSGLSSEHVVLSIDGFQGGSDISRKKAVCDIRQEIQQNTLTYLQTRPLLLDSYGFKILRHIVLRGKLLPAGRPYCLFIFASNDLFHWKGINAISFTNERGHICMPRNRHSFRHFVIILGGEARPGHSVSLIDIEGEGKMDNRLR